MGTLLHMCALYNFRKKIPSNFLSFAPCNMYLCCLPCCYSYIGLYICICSVIRNAAACTVCSVCTLLHLFFLVFIFLFILSFFLSPSLAFHFFSIFFYSFAHLTTATNSLCMVRAVRCECVFFLFFSAWFSVCTHSHVLFTLWHTYIYVDLFTWRASNIFANSWTFARFLYAPIAFDLSTKQKWNWKQNDDTNENFPFKM